MHYLIIASLIWGCSFAIIKSNLSSLDPNFVAFTRIFLAIPLFVFQAQFKGLSMKDYFILWAIGAIQYGLMFVPYIFAYKYLDAYQIALLCITTPIYVTLFNDCFEKQFNTFIFFMAILSVLGVFIILYNPNRSFSFILEGFLLIEGANVCFAFGQVAYKRFRQKKPELIDQKIMFIPFLGGLMVTAFSTTISHGWSSFFEINLTHILSFLYVGTISSGIAFFCWNRGAVLSSAGTLAILNNLKIPIGVVCSLVFLNEKVNLFNLVIGSTILILAVILAEKEK